MKKILLFILPIFMLCACGKKENQEEVTKTYHIFTIEPYKETCSVGTWMIVSAECFVVITEKGEKETLSSLSFNDFQKGYRYKVKVLKTETKLNRKEPWQDELSDTTIDYKVVEVLKKEKVSD